MDAFSYIQGIHWREPLWLLLVLQPFLLLLINKLIQKNNISRYADKKLQPWVVFPNNAELIRKIFSKNSAYFLAWLMFSVALAGPRTPLTQSDKEQLFGANIMVVLDLSRSMKAMDIKPSRLQRAKTEIYELLNLAQNHRVGITVYSARPHLLSPITSDHTALQSYIESIDRLSFPTQGSNPVDAILFAQKELIKSKGKPAVILLTDGDFKPFSKSQIISLKKHNIPLYILGVGTPEGEAIPLKDGTWLKHEQQYIVSKMNVENLESLASQLNGAFSPVYDDISDWDTIYNNGVSKHSTISNISNEQQILWKENFTLFLIAAIILFFIALNTYRFKLSNKNLILTLSCITLTFIPKDDVIAFELGQTNEQAGYRAYTNKDYSNAEKHYKDTKLDRLYYGYLGQGNSLYKMGHYKKAIQQFTFAVLDSKNDSQRAGALYNLANSHFRTGDFLAAINTYKDTLRYQPTHRASIHNLQVSKILRKNLEQRIKEEQRIESLTRQGNGPRTTNIAAGTEINDNTSVSVGDSSNSLNPDIPIPVLPNLDEDTVKNLLVSGLNNIKLAQENNNILAKENKHNTNNNLGIINAKQQLIYVSDSKHLLWKRLFEIEEGFPAPVENPRVIPEVDPW